MTNNIFDKFIELEEKKIKNENTVKPSKEVMNKKEVKDTKHFVRSLIDPITIAETQKIYNPNMPMNPRAPTNPLIEKGSSSSLSSNDNWGTVDRG
jgi:hypothetical protein